MIIISTFPQQVDVINEFLDITVDDSVLLTEFQNAIRSGALSLANSILIQIENYDKKIVNASRLNEMRSAILAMEQFYGTDIEPYLDAKQIEWQGIIDRFSYQGDYNGSTQYAINNIVKYSSLGLEKLYICTEIPPIGTLPTNTSYFRVFTIRGEKGASGTGSTFDFEWDSGYPYNVNTIVVYENKWWNCSVANTNQTPSDGSSYWSLVLDVTQPNFPVQADEPIGQGIGELWFQVLS